MAESTRPVPEATVARLPVYLRSLVDLTEARVATVSSERLAELAGVNAAKVRKDLSYLGSYGTRGVGYDVEYLVFQMSRELGLTQDWPVVIMGVGNLGQALANYGGFGERGFPVVGLIDADPKVVGTIVHGVVVRPVDDLPVWSIVCVVVRGGHRRQGVTRHLIEGALGYARANGAPAVEVYPVDPQGRMDTTMAFVGTKPMFERAGFVQVGTTDATLEQLGLVILEDDKQLQNAENLVPMVNSDFLAEHGDVADVLNEMSAGLTTEDLTAMIGKVDLERLEPDAVAQEYLTEKGLIGG